MLLTTLFALGSLRLNAEDIAHVDSRTLGAIVRLCNAEKTPLYPWYQQDCIPHVGGSTPSYRKMVAVSRIAASNLFRQLATSARFDPYLYYYLFIAISEVMLKLRKIDDKRIIYFLVNCFHYSLTVKREFIYTQLVAKSTSDFQFVGDRTQALHMGKSLRAN